MKVTNICDEVKAAGRTEDVCNIIDELLRELDPIVEYPLWSTNGSRAEGRAVIRTLNVLRSIVTGDEDPINIAIAASESSKEDFYIGWRLITNRSDICLHNYAVMIAHRSTNFEHDMEYIRSYMILNSIAGTLVDICQDHIDDEERNKRLNMFDVPNGWRSDSKFPKHCT